jgi:hypothetical protein
LLNALQSGSRLVLDGYQNKSSKTRWSRAAVVCRQLASGGERSEPGCQLVCTLLASVHINQWSVDPSLIEPRAASREL